MSSVMNVCIPVRAGGTIAVGTAYHVGFVVPTDAIGGGITVTKVDAVSANAIAAGSAPVYYLVTLGTNSAVNGTVGTVAAGAFTAGTLKPLTITSAFVDAGYGVAVQAAGTAVNADQIYTSVLVQYVMGR